VTPYSLLFFGGEISVGMDEDQEVVTVDHWIKFKCRNTVAILVQVYFLRCDYSSPDCSKADQLNPRLT
jgi:hypothetical protein